MNINKTHLFVLSLAILLITNTLWAQPAKVDLGRPYITTFNSVDYGKAASQNWAIQQDNRGILYFGNNDGVLINNGTDWNVLEVTNETAVRALALDTNNRLYIGANNELGYMAYNKIGQPLYVSLLHELDEKYHDFGDIYNISITDYGIYFFAREMIFIFKDSEFIVLQNLGTHQASSAVYDNSIFIFMDGMGLTSIKDNNVVLLPDTENIQKELGEYYFLIPYSDSEILLGGSNGFMYIYDIIRQEKRYFQTEMEAYGKHNVLANGIKVDDNRFIFSTLQGGIFLLDNNGQLLQIINSGRGLPNNQARQGMLIDQHGHLWTCAQSGLCYVEFDTPLTLFDKENGISDTILKLKSVDGVIYAATMDGLYVLPEYEIQVENDTHAFQRFYTAERGIWSILQLDDLLLGGDNNKLVAVKDKKAYEIPFEDEYGLVLALEQSNKFDNYIFAGTRFQGIVILEITDYTAEGIPILKTKKILNEFEGQMTFQITSDKNGDLWVNMYSNGLWHIRFTGDSVLDYEVDKYGIEDGLPSMNWNMPDELDDKIIIKTEKGIYNILKSDPDNYKFETDTTFGDSFKDVEIMHQQRDPQGRLWILYSTSEITNQMALVQKDSQGNYYFESTYFKRLKDRVMLFTIDEKGILWLGCSQSLQRFDTNQMSTFDLSYQSLVTKVINNRQDLVFNGTYYDPASQVDGNYTIPMISQPESLVKSYPFTKNSFIFEYSSVWFIESDATRFSVKLEGFDLEWSDWDDETKAVYTNLPDRKYTFKVKAKNIYGVESEIAEYSFSIKAPWYRHPIAFIIYGLAFVGIILLAVWLVNRRLIAAKERLERIVEERTKDLAEEKSKSEALLLNVLPEPIAARLKTGEKTIVDKFNDVSVLFADIAGFTKMAENLGPDKLVDNLNTIFHAFDILIKKYNIEKIKTIGDCYMTAGGVPVPFEKHLHNTALLALDMLDVMATFKEEKQFEIDMRIGIACGPVVAGIIGTEKFIYDLWGDTVNTASRMESHGGLGRVHVTDFVYEKLKDDFEFEYRGDIEVKGKGEMKTYFLIGPKTETANIKQNVSEPIQVQ